jgi:hypothetical protein
MVGSSCRPAAGCWAGSRPAARPAMAAAYPRGRSPKRSSMRHAETHRREDRAARGSGILRCFGAGVCGVSGARLPLVDLRPRQVRGAQGLPAHWSSYWSGSGGEHLRGALLDPRAQPLGSALRFLPAGRSDLLQVQVTRGLGRLEHDDPGDLGVLRVRWVRRSRSRTIPAVLDRPRTVAVAPRSLSRTPSPADPASMSRVSAPRPSASDVSLARRSRLRSASECPRW